MTLFSVILPTHSRNQSGMLARSIQSVLKQSLQDLELIVVDDGSNDGSADTIRHFEGIDGRVKHIRLDTNIGLPALTCAHAFLKSKGKYVSWMFDDCEWDDSFLHRADSKF